jgi:putative restriction endonuclease
MGHCVFMVRPDSIYDDVPSERYQFPRSYLGRAKEAAGDWIVYLEPAKVPKTRGYFAVAYVEKIIPDPKVPDRFLAVMEPGSYLEFGKSVPFNDGSSPIERGLLNERGVLSGRAQAAVRPISSEDFLRILERGLDESEQVLPRLDADIRAEGLAEGDAQFQFTTERERIAQLVSRPVRKRAFRRNVLRAYDERCAFSGLKFINGGGRAEVDAAHIRPVEHNGPDCVQNGLALSGTAHWMFDRGLIALSDDLEILISRKVNDVDSITSFINKNGRANAPDRKSDWPHPHFLNWHREFWSETTGSPFCLPG